MECAAILTRRCACGKSVPMKCVIRLAFANYLISPRNKSMFRMVSSRLWGAERSAFTRSESASALRAHRCGRAVDPRRAVLWQVDEVEVMSLRPLGGQAGG